ncbi:LPD1 domain-containing protein [Enterococcus faecium]|uniref:LPD1 domain-containing protein n=1 Tax=Enterococcus faecium TaxID=1352 RepID=UPI00352397A8
MDTATDQIENSLTSLMKTKFGVTRSSSVKLTEKDTLYTIFRKLADNIYKNGTWTQEDEIQAVDTLIRNRNNFSIDTENIIWTDRKGANWQANVSITPIDGQDKLTLGNRIDGKIAYKTLVDRVNLENKEEKTKKTYVLLDPENKSGTKHAKFYYFGSGTKEQLNYFAIGNMNRAIGYDKLQRDILKEFESQKDSLSFDKGDLEGFIRKLSSSEYSGKSNEPMFKKDFIGELTDSYLNTLPRDESMRYLGQPYLAEEMVKKGEVDDHNREWVEKQLATNWGDLTSDPDSKMKVNLDEAPYILQTGNFKRYIDHTQIKYHRKNNKIIDFVQKYVENTYDLILQVEYEKDIEKQTRASAWQTKKNINIETQKIMDSTPLKKYFKFIELDNDVDLNLFGQFEQEMERIHEVLPKTGNKSLELRLRKLGNYRALGMYVPTNNTIAIDFRDYGDDIGGVGIQSFIHEYAHALDYSIGNGRLLSMSDDFRGIVMKYRENLNLNGQNSYVAKKGGYYTTPTEVFARAFELYVSEAGFKSALLKSEKVYKTRLEYSLFDKKMREEISLYFDQVFPDLKAKINEFMKNSNKKIVNEPKKSISSEGQQYKKARNHEERKKLYNNAANKNIVDVAESLGMVLRGRKSGLYWEEHDSFRFDQRQNYFYWNSQRIGGGPIQLVRLIKKCTTSQAVDYLQNLNESVFDVSKIPSKKPFKYFMKESTDLTLTKDYLVNERKLSLDTVNFFISKGLIAQSTYKDKETGKVEPVVVFKHKDNNGKIRGVALKGIIEDYEVHESGRLKKTFGDGFTGMSIKIGNPPSMKDATDEKPLKIIAFEATIDLMSYYELHKESIGDAVLVSMNGLRKGTISKLLANSIAPDITEEMKENYLDVLNKHYKPTNKVQIILAVDNDEYNEKTGVKAAQDFVDNFNVTVFPVHTHIPNLAPNQTKNDWNEQLKLVKAGALKKEEIKTSKKIIREIEGGNDMSQVNGIDDKGKIVNKIKEEIANLENLKKEYRDNYKWDELFEVNWSLIERSLVLDAIEKDSVDPILSEIAEIEDQISEREKDSYYADSFEQSGQISKDIRDLKTRKNKLIDLKEKCIALYGVREVSQNVIESKLVSEDKVTKQKNKNSQRINETSNEENLKSLLDVSSIPEENITAEKDISVSKSNKVTEEVSTLLETFKEDTDSILLQAAKKPEQYLTKAEIEKMLDDHMLKVEEAIKIYTTKFEDIKEPTRQETEQISKGIKDTIQSILEEFKHNLQKYILDKKNHTVSMVTGKVDDIRTDIRNAINKRILIVNDLVKKFAEKVDKKFTIESKINKEELEKNNTEKINEESKSTDAPSKDLLSAKEQHKEQLIDARNQIIASKDFLRSNKLTGEKLSPVQKVKMYDQKINELDIEIEALKNKKVKTNVSTNKENFAPEKNVETRKKVEKKQSQENNDELKTLISKNDNPGITQYLNEKAKGLMKEKSFKKYLESISNFSKFSRSNIQLLMEQNPNATQVASVNKWKELGFELKQDPKEMYVRTNYPTIKKDKNGDPILDKNGEAIKEYRERLVPVFDISEVVGDKKELDKVKESIQELSAPRVFTKVFKTLTSLTSADVSIENLPDSINSQYDFSKNKIIIRPGLGEEATIKEMIYLMNTPEAVNHEEISKREKFEREAVSYVVASYFGINVRNTTFDYLKEPTLNVADFIESLDKITDQANKLVSQIDQRLEHSISKNSPKNKFEERLFQANSVTEETQKIAVKQESVDNPKVSSPSLSR